MHYDFNAIDRNISTGENRLPTLLLIAPINGFSGSDIYIVV